MLALINTQQIQQILEVGVAQMMPVNGLLKRSYQKNIFKSLQFPQKK